MSKKGKRVVVVTGGTRGIGRVIAELFYSRGSIVAVCSRSRSSASLPKGIMHQKVDVQQQGDLQEFVRAVKKKFGSLDVFINCAGISRWKEIGEIDGPCAAELIGINLLGTLWGCQAAAAVLPSGGCIINVSSLAGKRGSANNSLYCASKFAVNGITQALAKELGPRGIRVNAVCPVYVPTPEILSALAESSSPAKGRRVQDYLRSFAAEQTALGRLPTAAEVADVVFFLAGPAAAAVTGQCLNVDCGTFPQ